MAFRIPFSQRAHHYTEAESTVAVTAMREAVTLTQGEHLQAFESLFREYAEIDNAFGISNATAGLELSAQLCQFKRGDEVIIPSHTFTSSAYPFAKAGARIIWADMVLADRYGLAVFCKSCQIYLVV